MEPTPVLVLHRAPSADPALLSGLGGAGYRVLARPLEGGDLPSEMARVVVLDADFTERAELERCRQVRLFFQDALLIARLPPSTPGAMQRAIAIGADAVVPEREPLLPLLRTIRRELRARASSPGLSEREQGDPALIGEGLEEVHRLIALAASSSASVLLTGETGTGKEVAARALHRLSPRRGRPFVAVSCAALPEALIEAELFGHERGAFTGAQAARKGRFELADGGTLLLDEIGELQPALQVKLLRVLQERVVERLGGGAAHRVDVRVIAATNRDLDADVAAGTFRADLYYRLKVLSIHLPPLRERRADIHALWQHLSERIADEEGRPAVRASPRLLARLMRHSWPGNVRELENVVRHVAAVASGDEVTQADLPAYLAEEERALGAGSIMVPGMTLEEIERRAILETYAAMGRSAQATAEALGVSVRTVHYRLRKYREEGWLEAGRERTRSGISAPGEAAQRLLLAEDDDETRWLLAALLEEEGFAVTQVPTGTALAEQLGAAYLFEHSGPDVIVSDVRLPGMSGLEMLESVRANGWKIPVVLISGFADEGLRTYARSLGAELLEKPVDIHELKLLLRRRAGERAPTPRPGLP